MAQRLDLQGVLVVLLESDNVYFQPPPEVEMEYPCIVYHRERMEISHADNAPYRNKKRYLVTVIDRDPDSEIPDRVATLPGVSYDRFFTTEGLNHDVFRLFF